MHWKKLALVGLLVAVCLVAAGLSPESAPATALGFTSTPTFTPEPPTATATTAPPTATATLQPRATATTAPTLAPQPTQPPPEPTQPPPQPTQPPPTEVPPTPVPASAPSVPKTGSGLLWVVAAAGLGALLFGARKVRTS